MPTVIIPGSSSESVARRKAILDAWDQMPERAKRVAERFVRRIHSLSPRRRGGAVRAVLYGDSLTIPYSSDPGEIWHEVGHVIVKNGLLPEEEQAISRFYDFSKETRPPDEVLAEDFYFTIKGEYTSPFWEWWLMGDGIGRSSKEAGIRTGASVTDLAIVEAALDALADLVYNSDNEQYVWLFGIAKEALIAAQKEEKFSYEDRGGPHQYYFKEDLNGKAPSQSFPLNQPLRVERPDVTIRSTAPTAPGPGMM